MKPVIVYVDDEPNNLVVFEASMPDDWEIHVFDSPVEALKVIRKLAPWVIVSDERMPVMSGLEFLEVATQIVPEAVRMVVTGQTTEQTIIQLIRRAKIFDYVTKPWDSEDISARIENAIAMNRAAVERAQLTEALRNKLAEIEASNKELSRVTNELSAAKAAERELRSELEKWVPAQIVGAVKEGSLKFPLRREIVGIAFDIVNSSRLHNEEIFDRPIRSQILRLFTEAVIRNGGIRENHSGDSAYAHFGAFSDLADPYAAALAAAREFRVGLGSLASHSATPFECGISLHSIPDTLIQIHEIKVTTQYGDFVQKSFDTQSPGIDLLHRMEKLTHELPGSNIIMSRDFFEHIDGSKLRVAPLGSIIFKGQNQPAELFLLPSDQVGEAELKSFVAANFIGTFLKLAG
jgi:CheY-like chemotaxis protein